MEELWPPPAPEAAEAIRAVCQRLLPDAEALADALSASARRVQYDPAVLSDASLGEEDRDLNHSDLVQWLTSNIQHPGRRVEPYIGPRITAYIGDLVARGIAPDFAEGWRAALGIGWRRWLEECSAHCADRDLLVDVLDVSAKALMQYALDSVATLREVSLVAAMGNADAEAIALIQMIASGAPMAEDFAEERLRYRMARWHVGLVLWVDDPDRQGALDEAIVALRSTEAGRSTLVARASTTSRWVWLSGADTPDLHPAEKIVTTADEVRVAVGRPGRGLDGFRSSHQDALSAQALIVRLGSDRRFTAYADVELIDALTKDRASARRFVLKTLGPLAEADSALRQALLTYVQCGFNTTRAAANLYAHRNTIERRVSRANELSVVKVENNPTHVAAALLVLELAPEIMTICPS
ncbi:DNA-binding transcriptional regulator, PucR family [Amycolatopsis lurida]|uniref:PucR family transcriptional regulator n=1 Tax=Amycolatopsis lurida NRRL 2430 TaxID=1460371 RepID=A0A2P2FIU5_AMYLU|nr:helix-turn-helix domain-containing protein [Amycolatopsis lurida]KFU76647.1 PucR family transcriptional regulator [Amycolatopsis lurida NRRL 2430]SEE51824.1 DNA-binding transcriptional regulator, PucR family [Amycolatopsis lurida]